MPYSTAAKTARMTAVRDMSADGKLQLQDASNNVLVEWTLSGTGGSVTDDVWTLAVVAGTVQGLAAASGGVDATQARIIDDSAGVVRDGMTVGTTGTDVIVSNVNIEEDQDVILSSATLTHA